MNIQIFFRQAISQNSSKPLIVKGFCLFRMPNDCCFRWAAQGQLPQCNRRNIVTVLKTVVKSHNGLKGTKVFACGCFGRNLKNFSKFAGKSPCWSPFLVKLRPVILYLNFIKKRRLLGDSYTSINCKFWEKKIMNTAILGDCLWNNMKIKSVFLEFSYAFFINKCSLLHQNNNDHSGRVW